jgi:hypothetical protein
MVSIRKDFAGGKRITARIDVCSVARETNPFSIRQAGEGNTRQT